jgi:transposase InsO family protein
MPWQERSVMSERQEFVAAAAHEGANIAALCRDFGISRPTGYRWLARAAAGDAVLADRSRRPHSVPGRTSPEVEARVLAVRAAHPAWGGRKVHHWLVANGCPEAPAPSTITAILRRHGLLTPEPPRRDFLRFERGAANELWQMDFMGHHPLAHGRVHPLTLLDDHSRFAVLLAACANEQQPTVQAQLTAVFRRYGLPDAILTDNGSPWATAGMGGLTALEAWLLRLGIEPCHGRPRHPQTQGKIERLHGTIAAEVFAQRSFPDLPAAQAAFDAFRSCYNHERPHEALADTVPALRYHASARAFPDQLPEIVYGAEDVVCTVTEHGSIQWRRRRVFVSRGLVGQPVAVRPTAEDGVWAIVYCRRQVATIDLTVSQEV